VRESSATDPESRAMRSKGRHAGAIRSGGQDRSRSAELHSAVSRIFNPQADRASNAFALADALPNAIRRYRRLQICATTARHFQSHPRHAGAIRSGGQDRLRSAELHSAVSRIFNPQADRTSNAFAFADALPNAIRRYSRLQICATTDRHFQSHPAPALTLTPPAPSQTLRAHLWPSRKKIY